MSVIEIAERRRDKTFQRLAQTAIEDGYAVGSPDETGWPRIRASIHPIGFCAACGGNRPTPHDCPGGDDDGRAA